MRTRDFVIVFVCLAAAAGLLYAAGAQLDYINAQREALKIVINPVLENAPPSLAFATVAMGAFRGLVVDILWMRADKLKEEGQFFDARQLAEWITKLQPRFAAVWEFHAWNMAYNISVAIPATQPEQRWRWVRNGYELLRDEGIPLNPRSIQLYQELARIFQHKLGGVSDDAQEYYKLQFAEEIGPLFESEDNGLRRDDNKYFEALIRSVGEWSQVANDPNVAVFIQVLRAAEESFASEENCVKNYLALRREDSARLSIAGSEAPAGEERPASRFKPAAFEVLNAYRGTDALKRFDIFAKAYQLRHVWKLDPALMLRVSQRYGPIDFQDPNKHFPMDWRHPDSHAIYWALKGLDIAKQDKDREIGPEEVNTDRLVLHSLQNLFRYGKIMIVQGWEDQPQQTQDTPQKVQPVLRKNIYLGPDPRIFDSYEKAYQAVFAKYGEDRGRRESYENGHRNMLKNAVLVFYQAGLRTEAVKIYNELRKQHPQIEEFKVPLDQFARNRIVEELDGLGITDASEQIVSLLINAYGLYAVGDDNAASTNEQLAQRVWDYYKLKFGDNERIDLPPMRVLKWFALNQFVGSDAYPLYVRQGLLARIKREKPDLFKELQQTGEEMRQQVEQFQKTQKQ